MANNITRLRAAVRKPEAKRMKPKCVVMFGVRASEASTPGELNGREK